MRPLRSLLLGDADVALHGSVVLRGPLPGNPKVAGHPTGALTGASYWAMPTSPSMAALCCVARCRATRRLQGTPQGSSQERATSLWSGATLLLELALSAGILPRWADSTSLLGADFLRSS